MCYTATPQTAKTYGFRCPLAVDCETVVEQFTVSTLRCCGVPYFRLKTTTSKGDGKNAVCDTAVRKEKSRRRDRQ